MVPEPLWGLGGGVCAGLRVFTAPEEVSLQPQGLSWKNIPGQERKPCLSWSYLKMYRKGPVTWMGWPGLTLQSQNTGHVTQLQVTGSNYS